jgi:DNA repair exonuclease SbcCD ATPase subunit
MMSTVSPEPEHAQPSEEGEQDLVRYVEDLAGPGDYWISITDAARITRTSEAMARRWVSAGRLPIRRQAVGLNQRTRMVRASDLEQIRPIVDPSAAITDAVRKVDIPSIPRVQERLLAEQQHLIAQVQDMQEAVRDVGTRLEQVAARHLQDAEALREQLLAHQDELHRAVDVAQQHHEALSAQLADQARQAEQRNSELAEQIEARLWHIETVEGEVSQRLEALARQQEAQQHEIASLRQDLVEQQAALQAQQEMLIALLEQHRRDVFASLEQRAVEQAEIVTTVSARVARIEERLEQVASSAEARAAMMPDYQARHEVQDRLIETLTGQLQEEIEARQALEASLVTLEGQYQELCRTVEGLAKRRKRSGAAQ